MLCQHINDGIASSDYMESKVTISFIALVISFIIVLVIIDNLSKSESLVLLPFSSITSINSAFALEVSNNDSRTNSSSLLNTKLVNGSNTHAMNDKGVALMNLGKNQEAITWFDKVLAINKNDADAMINKGHALIHLGKHQEAITWFDKVLAINGNDTGTYD